MLLAVAVPFLLAAAAHAGPKPLATPPLDTEGSGTVICGIVHVGQKTRDVTIQVLLASTSAPVVNEREVELGPREAAQTRVFDPCTNGGCGSYRCEFHVQGPKSAYRAAICTQDTAGKVSLRAATSAVLV
jgi:hypothetical protein